MKALLIYLSGEQSIHDLAESPVFSGAVLRGTIKEMQFTPPVVTVRDDLRHLRYCLFTLQTDEKMGNLLVYREVPWVLAG